MMEEDLESERPEPMEENYHEAHPSVDGSYGTYGTILEAAFVDPAYSWPPAEGEGRNAIELQASVTLLDDNVSVVTTESEKARMALPEKPESLKTAQKRSKKWWQCCYNDSAVVDLREYEQQKKAAIKARKAHHFKRKHMEKEYRKKNRYNRIPEGILIYRLDTATQTLSLMSEPHAKTDLKKLIKEMVIAHGRPSPDRSRRGMILTGVDGTEVSLVACEQRTAISWLEAIDLMAANHTARVGAKVSNVEPRGWRKNNLSTQELDQIEGQYLNLASYSNKLIRSGKAQAAHKGTSPSQVKKSGQRQHHGGAGGIYYSIEVSKDPADQFEEEALESIAKRRAVIKDSWDFYRMICSLLRDRRKYEEVFRKIQLDPVYPYLRSMTGLNDSTPTSQRESSKFENLDKTVVQRDLPEYSNMTRNQVAKALVRQAEAAMPSLVEICKALAGSLGMEEVGIGPIKEANSAIRKAEKKYGGDLLKVTDYCRALLVVKDLPSLLALLELARDSFGPLIRRVKLSSLKASDGSAGAADDALANAKTGGYRDCIINVELKDHICEIQVHLYPMWVVCGVDGFRHYRHSLEYSTDSFDDPYDALEGLDRKTMAELIVMAEEAVADTPLDNLEWFQEHYILDYFAEVGLFMKHGLYVWAEITLRHLIRLRTESPDIGPEHHETILLYSYLNETLKAIGGKQNKREAADIQSRLKDHASRLKKESEEAEKSLWDCFMSAPSEAMEMIMDPNKKEREEEENLRKEVKASKKQWRRIRRERFGFLDTATTVSSAKGESTEGGDEKKLDDQMSQ